MSSWFSRLGNKVENILPSFDEFDAKEEGQSITLPPSKAQHILEPPKPPHLLPSYQNALLPKKKIIKMKILEMMKNMILNL